MDAKYKFEKNLLRVSLEQINIDTAKKEWKLFHEENDSNGLCICQHHIKNINYLYNIKTKNIIMVGSTCYKKFKMNNGKIKNTILNTILCELIKGRYSNIDDTYCKMVETQLLTYFENKYEQYKHNVELLKTLSFSLDEIISEYELEFLKPLYTQVNTSISEFKYFMLNKYFSCLNDCYDYVKDENIVDVEIYFENKVLITINKSQPKTLPKPKPPKTLPKPKLLQENCYSVLTNIFYCLNDCYDYINNLNIHTDISIRFNNKIIITVKKP